MLVLQIALCVISNKFCKIRAKIKHFNSSQLPLERAIMQRPALQQRPSALKGGKIASNCLIHNLAKNYTAGIINPGALAARRKVCTFVRRKRRCNAPALALGRGSVAWSDSSIRNFSGWEISVTFDAMPGKFAVLRFPDSMPRVMQNEFLHLFSSRKKCFYI